MSEIIEESLQRIAKGLEGLPSDTRAMIKQLKIIVQGIKDVKPKDMGKVAADVEKESKKLSASKIANRKKIDELYGKHEEEVEQTSKSIGMLGVISKDAGRQFGRFGKSLARVDGSFRSVADSLSNLPAIGGVFAGFAVLAGVIDSTVDAYRTVTQSGIQFENGILGLVQSSGELGLSLDDTANMYKKYNTTIQRIGAPAFTGFIKEVRANSSDLYALGFTYKDIVESSAQFLETQRNLTGLRTLNQQEQSKLFDNTMKEFYKAAQITGVGVEQLLKSLNDLSEDPRTRLILKSLPEEGQRMIAAMREIDPKLAETVLEALQKGAVERVDNYEDIVVSGTKDLVQGIVDMAKDGSGSVANLRDFLKANEQELASRAGELGIAGLDGGLSFAASLLKTMNDMVVDPKQNTTGGETDKLSELLLKLGPQINETIARIREILLNFTVDILGPDGSFGEIIASGLIKFIEMVTNPANIAALTNFIDGVFRFTRVINGWVSSFQSLTGNDNPFLNVILTGIGGLMAAKTALWLAKAAASNLFGAVFGALGSAIGMGVRRSPLSRLMRGGAAVGALAAGGALLYREMYKETDETSTAPTTTASNDIPTISPDETEFEKNIARERELLTASDNIVEVPAEIQEIVDKMNAETAAIISETEKKSEQQVSDIEAEIAEEKRKIAEIEADYAKEQRQIAIRAKLAKSSKNYFDKTKEQDASAAKSSTQPTSPDPAHTATILPADSEDASEAAVANALADAIQKIIDDAAKEKLAKPAAPVTPINNAPSGIGQPLGTPELTKPDIPSPGANMTLEHEKRMLELAEENTMLTKILAGSTAAAANKTIDTQRILTSNII